MSYTPPVDFVTAIKRGFNQYATFNGRAMRSEFWWWYLFTFIVSCIFSLLATMSGLSFFNWLNYLFGLAVLIPTLALSWRRLHDIGKAGGWWFINLIPLVGAIIFIIWCAKDSEQGPNRFGPEPDPYSNPV